MRSRVGILLRTTVGFVLLLVLSLASCPASAAPVDEFLCDGRAVSAGASSGADRLVNGVAYEAKAGVGVGLTSSIRKQVLKDAELVATGQLRGAEWHFFQGAQDDLLMFLKDRGIRYTVHP